MTFIKAKAGPPLAGDPKGKFTVHYFDEAGNLTIRSGGTRTWRCNNPDALLKSPYSMGKDRRAIGKAGDPSHTYAVYPDYKTGHEALIVMLRGSKYSPLTLKQDSKRYVSDDPKHIEKIIRLLKHQLTPDRTIQSLSDAEFELYWKAIEKNEHWEVGNEDFIERWHITGVHKNRGTITKYLVKQSSRSVWIPKSEALKLANEFRLHVIIIHLKNGTCYLRPEYGTHPFELVT